MVAEAGKGKLTCSLFLARDLHCEKQSTKHHPSSEPTSFGYSHPSLWIFCYYSHSIMMFAALCRCSRKRATPISRDPAKTERGMARVISY